MNMPWSACDNSDCSVQVKSSLFIVTLKMYKRTQRKTIQSPKSAEPKQYNKK